MPIFATAVLTSFSLISFMPSPVAADAAFNVTVGPQPVQNKMPEARGAALQ